MTKIFLKECFVENIYQYDALIHWDELKKSPCCVRFRWDDKVGVIVSLNKCGSCIGEKQCSISGTSHMENVDLGTLPKEDVNTIDKILQANWKKVFCGIVSYVNDSASDENKKIKIAIYVKKW